jgi:hypothetical protein
VADGTRFAALQKRSVEVGKGMKKDASLEAAQTLLAAVQSCVLPGDPPERDAARRKIQKAIDEQTRRK